MVALSLLLALGCRTTAAPTSTTNVVVFTWETTRADHTSVHGHPLRTTPYLQALAAEGLVFEHHVSAAPWTLPSVSSILTGLSPTGHGVRAFEDVLGPKVETLPERLQAAGYHTAMLGVNSIFEADRGLEQGFHSYFGQGDVPGEELSQRMLAWLDSRPADRPFFLYVHLFEPHCPYDPPPLYEGVFDPWPAALRTGRAYSRQRWEQMFGCFRLPAPQRPGEPVLDIDRYLAAYDAELHHADHLASVMIERLRSRGLLDRTLLLVTGDHGEEFLDHGDHGHGRQLYEESVHVPLVVRPPGDAAARAAWAGRRVAATTSSVDIAATVLAAAGLPAAGEGLDLSPAWTGGGAPSDWSERAVYSGTDHEAHLRSVQRGRWKLIAEVAAIRPEGSPAPAPRPPELYDLAADPGEQHDQAAAQPAVVAELSALLREHEAQALQVAARTGTGRRALDAETEEALRRLGYLE